MASLSDCQLVTAAREGIAEAFSLLAGRYVQLVHFVLLLRLGRCPQHDTILAEVFAEMFRQLPHRSPQSNFGYALHMVAAQKCARAAISLAPGSELLRSQPGLTQRHNVVLALLQQLPDNCQLATVVDFLGLPPEAAATFLRMSVDDMSLLGGRGKALLCAHWRPTSDVDSETALANLIGDLVYPPEDVAQFSERWERARPLSRSQIMWALWRNLSVWGIALTFLLFIALWIHLPATAIAVFPMFVGMMGVLVLALVGGKIALACRQRRARSLWQSWLQQ